MAIGFRRPIGSPADVKELEYISALHQTDLQEVRSDGSIDENDIQLFLLSRYGIDVTTDDIRSKVIRGLAGGNEDEDDKLDLMEVVAMLLIPTLRKAAYDGGELPKGLVRPREGLLDYVLQMMLHDCTGTNEPKKLSKELIRRLLQSYGEMDLAANDDIIEEMLQAASTPSGVLDGQAFAQALTKDVQLYNITSEVRMSTIYDDVFLTKNLEITEDWDEAVEGISKEVAMEQRSLGIELKSRRYTFSAIDTTAGTYRSKGIIVLLWSSFSLAYFVYYYKILGNIVSGTCDEYPYVYGASWTQQGEAMACSVVASVSRWLIVFVFVVFYGIFFIGASSIGNYVDCKRWYMPLIGALWAFSSAYGPYTSIENADKDIYLSTAALILGLGVCVLHIFHMLSLLLPKAWIRRTPLLERILLNQPISGEANVKRAAAFKMSEMTKNALNIAEDKQQDGVLVSHFGQGLQTFSQGEKHTVTGGFMWTWEKIFNGELFHQEGIWLSARLVSSNVAQFIVTIFVLVAGIRLSQTASEEYSKDQAKATAAEYITLLFDTSVNSELSSNLVANISSHFSDFLYSTGQSGVLEGQCNSSVLQGDLGDLGQSTCDLIGGLYECDSISSVDYLCALAQQTGNATISSAEENLLNLGLLNASGLDVETILAASKAALHLAAESSVDSLYPAEKYMVEIPIIVGSIFAFLTAVSLAVTYIPSTSSTTLKLRCGVIPTLRNPKFHLYRVAADQVTVLLGSLFWGCLIASILVGSLVGGVIFLFLWQASIALVQRFLSALIGLVVVILLKIIMVQSCRCACYTAFYRRRPMQANFSSLALECANYALSVGFVLIRMIKLLITSALYVGRIDAFFLAPGVGELKIGKLNFRLDNYPHIFLKDILSNEAHRHPYIELLGCMYLLKLRYGDHFGNRGGSTWRLLFVYSLMPWMHKYRIAARPRVNFDGVAPSTTKSLQFVDLHRDYDFSTELSSEMINENSLQKSVEMAPTNLLATAMLPGSMRQLETRGAKEEDDDDDNTTNVHENGAETTMQELRDQVRQLQAALRKAQMTPVASPVHAEKDFPTEPQFS